MSNLFLSSTRATRTKCTISHWQRVSGCRMAHHATQLVKDVSEANSDYFTPGVGNVSHALLPRRGKRRAEGLQKVKELERRVQALDEAIQVDTLAFNPLTYSDEDLLVFYEDVLSFSLLDEQGTTDKSLSLPLIENDREDADRRHIEALTQRLLGTTDQRQSGYRDILARAHKIISRSNVDGATSRPSRLSLGILSIAECEALIRVATKAGDRQAAESVVDLMRMDRMVLPKDSVTAILKAFSDSGHIQALDLFLGHFVVAPNAEQRHLHVMAHLKAASVNAIPTSALTLLHNYEQQNTPAPIQTYTSIITHLFSCSSAVARSQAWDIFTHMRYVAHPVPDAVLYTLMIRACASPVSTRFSSEPEKALDLWTEMTVDQNIAPTVGAYNAIILACARSGTKTYVNEAFRLARQMLDSHRDAHGISPFRPNKGTFCALLEGAKRLGDLGRARWILAEMVQEGGNGGAAVIDEEVMMHVFNAYASYNVPSARSSVKLRKMDDPNSSVTPMTQSEPSETSVQATNMAHETQSSAMSNSQPAFETNESQPALAHIPPQSRSEVIREVKALFQCILADRTNLPGIILLPHPVGEETTTNLNSNSSKSSFRNVEITTRLLNAYLSVFYKHGELSVSRELFWRLFEELGMRRSARTYLEVLERCANTRKVERDLALKFSEELWVHWQRLENAVLGHRTAISPRIVERVHVAMIRVQAINENLSRAMTFLRDFANKYPPNSIRTPTPKLHFQSTRTSLVGGSRPLVRMTSSAEMVVDDRVPPLITFRDVEILHHRLVDEEGMKKKDIRYVTWLCKAYEGSLRIRRDAAIKAKPVERYEDTESLGGVA